MRKEHKQNIEKYIELLPRICEVMQRISSSNPEGKKQMLEECHQGLAIVKQIILEEEGERCPVLNLLEQYEASLPEGDMTIWNELKRSVEEDIKAKKEVVFLPYKASMWDSLESVWIAADQDPNCDAYVIPIPYYDKDSDGNFKEMHWEGDLYPKYVPVTDYREYDIEERRPDMIYIHNPYDGCNRVTSVHPDYYSKTLKAYTDNLIYIPYFVLGEVDIENEAAVERVAHFCKLPAVLNADKVIVQSEQMKQVYVKTLTKWQGEHTRTQWEEKVLGLGSPKFDKVANTRKEDLAIPEEWLRIIEKTDGSWKKVILYNTSLTTFLNNSDRYFEKVEDVLRVFKENKDEVALLWRPHPLFMQTIETARVKLKERYSEIILKYRTEGWGIYDESAELDRAIAVSDAYYGDASSVVQLCQAIGKPIMLQNVNIIKNSGVMSIEK